MSHSPEPWGIGEQTCLGGGSNCFGAGLVDAEGRPIFSKCNTCEAFSIWAKDADMERIVACVNALHEVEDPEGFMRCVRSIIRRYTGPIILDETGQGISKELLDFVDTEVPT